MAQILLVFLSTNIVGRKKMTKNDLELLALKVRDGKISIGTAVSKTAEFIYLNKAYFALHKLDEDDLHDFIIYEIGKLPSAFKSYRSEMGTFTTFLAGNIRMNFMSWRKTKIKKIEADEYLKNSSSELYSIDQERYETGLENEILHMEEQNKRQIKENDAEFLSENEKAKYSLKKSFLRSRFSDSVFKNRLKMLKKEALLYLSLKYVYFMDGQEWSKVSELSGIDEEMLESYKTKALKAIERKAKHRKSLINSRDRSYFYHQKYLMECSKAQKGTTLHRELMEKFKLQTKLWEEKNEKLRMQKFLPIVTNSALARILDVKLKHITYTIKLAKKNMDILGLNEYHALHENISGNWKFEQEKGNAGNFSPARNFNSKG